MSRIDLARLHGAVWGSEGFARVRGPCGPGGFERIRNRRAFTELLESTGDPGPRCHFRSLSCRIDCALVLLFLLVESRHPSAEPEIQKLSCAVGTGSTLFRVQRWRVGRGVMYLGGYGLIGLRRYE